MWEILCFLFVDFENKVKYFCRFRIFFSVSRNRMFLELRLTSYDELQTVGSDVAKLLWSWSRKEHVFWSLVVVDEWLLLLSTLSSDVSIGLHFLAWNETDESFSGTTRA